MTLQEKRTTMFTLVEQWQQSGLGQAAYAQAQNLSLVKFRYWIQKHRQDKDTGSAFIPLTGLSQQGICIRYPNGIELSLPVQTPAGVLKSLINI